jgi:cell wall assembly regulator SMI1
MSLDATTFDQLDPEATEEQVAAVEQTLGIRFPERLRRAFPVCHSGSPTPQMLISVNYPGVGMTETTVARFLSLLPESAYYIGRKLENLRREGLVPDRVVPFAVEGGGDAFALDYHESAEPAVVYLALGAAEDDSDDAHLVAVAPSFDAFLETLTPEP